MSRMKELYTEICELHQMGLTPDEIAERLKVSVNLVLGALEMERMSLAFVRT